MWPTLSRASYSDVLDLLMVFHQVDIETCDRVKTAFLTYRGLYVYNVMLFGLCNATSTFHRLMARVLGTMIGFGVFVYKDDLLIFAETQEQLIEIFSTVLKVLAEAGLKCKTSSVHLLFNK